MTSVRKQKFYVSILIAAGFVLEKTRERSYKRSLGRRGWCGFKDCHSFALHVYRALQYPLLTCESSSLLFRFNIFMSVQNSKNEMRIHILIVSPTW